MRDRHELGVCQPSEESIIRYLKIGDLKQESSCGNFPSPKGYGKIDLTDLGHCYTRDYAMERYSTGAQ
jgi:hypothetical protein